MSALLLQTIGNADWLRENIAKMAALFPKTWTHHRNLSLVKIGFQLKLLGIEWRSMDELGRILAYCEKAEILERDGLLIRQHPTYIILNRQAEKDKS